MYSQAELDDAVAAGVISAEAAAALRAHVERQRSAPAVDEEHFRLITGFNDIFVAIAAAILLFAVAWIGQRAGAALGIAVEHGDGPSPLAPAAVAAASWALALFFTAKRRMALPSILLLLSFVGGIFLTSAFALVLAVGPERLDDNSQLGGMLAAISGAIAAGAAWLHWRNFRVPITVAAGAASVAGIAIGLLIAAVGDAANTRDIVLGFMLLLGIATFLFAMWWDGSDRARVTRRADVAFWLHLLAAPMIVHPVFTLLGLNDGDATIGEGFAVIMLYLAIGVTALAIDRRALLVSALAYVLWALSDLFERFGAVELNVALTALVIGSALLLLSAFWNQARSAVVRPLPDGLKERLPIVNRPPSAAAQPAA
ncbi:MAG TPA: hypothetical protein VNH53_06405 [Sphingomicrobium sp.]|nr:hypothetical protein [Sphingomicrobium sp.]